MKNEQPRGKPRGILLVEQRKLTIIQLFVFLLIALI